jgi:Rrf2 family cysteine metabolism transcriptional repressor
MHLSVKGEYGIMTALDLALTRGHSPIQAKAIAQRQGIPIKFLEHILRALRHAGLVESSRGTHGGYRLAKPAEEIRLGDVIQAVEGPMTATNHLAIRLRNGDGQEASHESVVRSIWEEVKESILETLNRTTLADLSRRARDLDDQRVLMYHI